MSKQVKAGDPGPRRRCSPCGKSVATYFDVTGGQWELRCNCCNKPVQRLTSIQRLSTEASDRQSPVRRKPKPHKDKV